MGKSNDEHSIKLYEYEDAKKIYFQIEQSV